MNLQLIGHFLLILSLPLHAVEYDNVGRVSFNGDEIDFSDVSQVHRYVNTPLYTDTIIDAASTTLYSFDASTLNLLNDGAPPGRDVVMGLAAYASFSRGFRRIVGSLRHFGFDGHIILGVNPAISPADLDYLRRMNVTAYGVTVSSCDPSISGAENGLIIRAKCSRDITTLKLEWGRFEMARRWLEVCSSCDGWVLAMDTRDIFFQDAPFRYLGNAWSDPNRLYFIEEVSPYTLPHLLPNRSFIAGNIRNEVHTVPCYGRERYSIYHHRPVLCSGTVIGARRGMLRFLSVLVNEFHANNRKDNLKCRSPHTTDQWIMNYLYYNGKFGDYSSTSTIPWGIGPVQTVGKPCITDNRKTGATDIVQTNDQGFLINRHDKLVSPIVHQFDRCYPWIDELFTKHYNIYQ